MPKMSRKLSLDEDEETEFAKRPKISRDLSPEETEEIEILIVSNYYISKQIEEIESTIRKIEEEKEPKGSQSRSEDVIETVKSLMNLKREYSQMVRNYNERYKKDDRIWVKHWVKHLQRVKFSDEIRASKSWGELDDGMLGWINYMHYTFDLDLDIPLNVFRI